MAEWKNVLELDRDLSIIAGNEGALSDAIRNGADLRIYTEFLHNEHIDTNSANNEVVREVSDFRVTYLIDDSWVAGIMNLRMPITPPIGFGPRPSMSFFMYNQNGRQAIARPYFDGASSASSPSGASPLADHSDMPKFFEHDNWDAETNAPSSNFTYHFEQMRFLVCDEWSEVYATSDDGEVVSGSFEELTEAFAEGSEIKVAINGICENRGNNLGHELFIHAGPGYHNTKQKFFSVGTQPAVFVDPAIPLSYKSENWDFGWLMLRTDGFTAKWICDPYSLKFSKSDTKHAMRWFVRD